MHKTGSIKTKGGSVAIKTHKTIIRDIDIPLKVSEQRTSIKKHFVKPPLVSEEVRNKSYNPIACNSKPKIIDEGENQKSLHTPKLNTMYHIIDSMDRLDINPNMKIENLTPKSKAIITSEVTKKLNFPYDTPVYTDLISIECDADETPDYANSVRNKRSIREKYITKERKKDPIPELKDCLSPVKRIEIKVPLYTRKDVIKPPEIDVFKKVHDIVTNHPSF